MKKGGGERCFLEIGGPCFAASAQPCLRLLSISLRNIDYSQRVHNNYHVAKLIETIMLSYSQSKRYH